jgi:hypothetical protein
VPAGNSTILGGLSFGTSTAAPQIWLTEGAA